MAKVISIEKYVSHNNGDSWKLADYPSFAETDNAEEWLGVDSISLERAKELAFELGGDEAYDIEDEINSATDLDELQDALSELKYFQRDNTYNQSWWGGVVDFGVLTEDGEGYGKGLILLRMHGGGDPRGNYYDMKAFELDSFIEDFPPYFSRLTYTISTDEGDLMLDTDDMEGYSMNVVSDETGTFEDGDYINLDDVESAFDMDGNTFYSFGGGVAVGGLLGAYLGYKIGRSRPQKKGFSTEKRVGSKIKSAFTKKKYDRGGDVQGVVWDKDSESIRTQLGEFVVLIYPQSQKGYYDVYVSANKKKVGSKNDIYGLDKAKDVAYDIIGNANKQYKGGGDVPMNVGIGSTIVFMSSNGDKREGEIISKLDENSWEVSHSFGVAMVKNDEILEVSQKSGRKKLFGIFENGGDVRNFSWYQDFKPKGQQSRQSDDLSEEDIKSTFSDEYDDLLKKYSPNQIAEMYDLNEGSGRKEFIDWKWRVYPYKNNIKGKYARGGNVNTGRSWHLDRARHNKSENYEIPMGSRKKRFDYGGGVSRNEAISPRLLNMTNEELAREYANTYPNESRREVLQNLNEERNLWRPMYLHDLHISEKVNSRSKYAQGGGVMNRQYLSSLPYDKKMVILNNIAKHYGVLVEDIENEVTDDEAENLYEYIANDNSLRMNVYNDFQRMSDKYAHGGMMEHGLRRGDKIEWNGGDMIKVKDAKRKTQWVNLDKGERYEVNGGKWEKGGNIDDLLKG
jgi:hypothetical protein